MTTYIASTTAEVQAMVAKANGGDTVLLAPGTYDNVRLVGITESTAVKIRSLDADNPAVLKGLYVSSCAGLNFSNLEVQTSTTRTFNVLYSHVINFTDMDVHGILNGSSQDDGTNGLLIRNSSYVNVTDSHFHELLEGINHINSSSIKISGNNFNLIGNDGVAGGGSSDVTITNNTFTDFDHVGAVHPDMIQFWTTNTTTAASDITVSGNVFDRGAGVAVQGIFIQDEVGRLAYKNVTITDNTIVGALYNAIELIHAESAVVRDNVVIGASDQASWIGIANVSYVNMGNNVATAYHLSNSNVSGHGDVLAGSLSLDADGGFPDWQSGTVVPAASVSDQAQTDILSAVNLIGYYDGPSSSGPDYDFGAVSLMGTNGANRLYAGVAGAYHIYGYGGDDSIVGNKSGMASTFEGGAGDDTYVIYQSIDEIVERAGEGTDVVASYVNYTLPDNVENARALTSGLTLGGNELNNAMSAAAGGDILYGYGGNDVLLGSTGADRLYGGDGDDRIRGNEGNDFIDGGNGNDLLYGNSGKDVINGGAGNDVIEGGVGADTLTGGSGADTFVYRSGDFDTSVSANTDTITDFNVSEGDRIALTVIDANSKTTAMDHFKFIGNHQFDGVAGELRWAVVGDGITVYGDTDGDKIADLAIHLTGLTSITSSSFII